MVNQNECCGCSACSVVCNHGALTMAFNDEGYYKPVLDEAKCVHCGLCDRVCPAIHHVLPHLTKKNTFLAVAKDRNVLERSSSGGVSYVMAKRALHEKYTVCGVGYDTKENVARHILIEHEKDLPQIQGSKYLKSANMAAFLETIKCDKAIVFGTPCEITGLDKVLQLKGIRERFILVDIFCHGVPSQLIWQQHLKWLKKKGKINGAELPVFRDKKNFILSIGKYSAWYNEDAFYTFFLRGWLRNEKCFSCDFRRTSAADVRIGDCLTPEYDRQLSYSPSCILANTERGTAFLNACYEDLEIQREDYAVIDGIQEKGKGVGNDYSIYMKRLKAGEYPQNIIAPIVTIGRVKSFLKNRLLRRVHEKQKTNDLPN